MKTLYFWLMTKNAVIAGKIAEALLQIKAIKLQPNAPFTWASGWKSPIYCDNRLVLSHPAARKLVYQSFAETIRREYPDAEVLAGVATGAIAHGVLVAEEMGLPFVYVREKSKAHGRQNQVEGEVRPGQKVVIIEDLISTGKSSLAAFEALKEAGCEILGMTAIFSYQFEEAKNNFQNAACTLVTLSDYTELISQAARSGYITEDQITMLSDWRKSPSTWNNESL
jgi:orotate phosphoribosyltransferase